MIPPQGSIHRARVLLEELCALLRAEGENNVIRGVSAALDALDGSDPERGFAEARAIYRSIAAGPHPFSDYYIHRTDWADRVRANERLDRLRDELWRLFDTP
jgi:hypothetical protein